MVVFHINKKLYDENDEFKNFVHKILTDFDNFVIFYKIYDKFQFSYYYNFKILYGGNIINYIKEKYLNESDLNDINKFINEYFPDENIDSILIKCLENGSDILRESFIARVNNDFKINFSPSV